MLVLLLLVVSVVMAVNHTSPLWQTVPVIPYWNLEAGAETVVKHRQDVSMVSPWLFAVDDAGEVVPAGNFLPSAVTALHQVQSMGLAIVPTVSNGYRGAFRREPIASVLHDHERRRRHVESLVRLARERGFGGIGIDYEELTSGTAGLLHHRGGRRGCMPSTGS
jgi:spore germination protein YaaH